MRTAALRPSRLDNGATSILAGLPRRRMFEAGIALDEIEGPRTGLSDLDAELRHVGFRVESAAVALASWSALAPFRRATVRRALEVQS